MRKLERESGTAGGRDGYSIKRSKTRERQGRRKGKGGGR